MKSRLQIAFYGKGGIGKSTVAANVSVAFALMGYRVLQIGCDPKGDSTRCLAGRRIPAVMRILKERGYFQGVRVEDILFQGFAGVACVEAGGPEPGVGCAGRGIITTMEVITRLRVLEMDWDVVVYDVLGDIVCGGFAVPIREGYAHAVYLVTSGEFMALYAANNIAKGIKRYAQRGGSLLGGIIHNCRFGEESGEVVDLFAQRLGSRVVGVVPWMKEVVLAEREAKTVMEAYSASPSSEVFRLLAKRIWEDRDYGVPHPLGEEDLETLGAKVV